MAKPITLQQHCTQVDLEREISKTRDGRYRLRLQAIVLVHHKL
jgi:hypothetical protein